MHATYSVTYMLGAEEPPKDAESAARRFILSFEQQFGANSASSNNSSGSGSSSARVAMPRWFAGSYRDAVTAAAQQRKVCIFSKKLTAYKLYIYVYRYAIYVISCKTCELLRVNVFVQVHAVCIAV
jgi:hypothetical protein